MVRNLNKRGSRQKEEKTNYGKGESSGSLQVDIPEENHDFRDTTYIPDHYRPLPMKHDLVSSLNFDATAPRDVESIERELERLRFKRDLIIRQSLDGTKMPANGPTRVVSQSPIHRANRPKPPPALAPEPPISLDTFAATRGGESSNGPANHPISPLLRREGRGFEVSFNEPEGGHEGKQILEVLERLKAEHQANLARIEEEFYTKTVSGARLGSKPKGTPVQGGGRKMVPEVQKSALRLLHSGPVFGGLISSSRLVNEASMRSAVYKPSPKPQEEVPVDTATDDASESQIKFSVLINRHTVTGGPQRKMREKDTLAAIMTRSNSLDRGVQRSKHLPSPPKPRRLSVSFGEGHQWLKSVSGSLQKSMKDKYEPRKAASSAYKKAKRGITIPEPFNFEDREKQRGQTIAQKRFRQEVLEKQREMDKIRHHKFRAAPIPATSIIPLYDNIRKSQEMARETVRVNSKKITEENQNPFTFYYRDKEKHEKRVRGEEGKVKENKTVFKAKPIPPEVKAPLFAVQQVKERERLIMKQRRRAEREQKRQELVRMQEAMREMEQQKVAEEQLARAPPKVARKEIPDFSKLQNEFSNKLQKVKASKTLTKPLLFASETLLKEKTVVEEAPPKPPTPRRAAIPLHLTAKPPPPVRMTLSMELKNEVAAKKLSDIEEREKGVKARKLAKEKKLALSRLTQKIDNRRKEFEEKNEQKRKEFVESVRERDRDYQKQLQDMEERVKARPLLLEQSAIDFEKRRAEEKFQKTLEDAGLDVSAYLDEAEAEFD